MFCTATAQLNMVIYLFRFFSKKTSSTVYYDMMYISRIRIECRKDMKEEVSWGSFHFLPCLLRSSRAQCTQYFISHALWMSTGNQASSKVTPIVEFSG